YLIYYIIVLVNNVVFNVLYELFILLMFFPIIFLFLFTLFFFNNTATTEIYTLSLHDALPILHLILLRAHPEHYRNLYEKNGDDRSEEHTSELQSRFDLVCRLLLEKKKINKIY